MSAGDGAPPRPVYRPRLCKSCGAPITPNEEVTGGFCAARACAAVAHKARVGAVADHREARRLQERRAALAAAEPFLVKARAALGGASSEALTADVPFTERRLAPADASQQAAFLDHLADLVAKAFAGPPADAEALEDVGAAAEAPEAASVAACAACRGWCCQHGAGRMAFLSVADIAAQRGRRPELDAEALLALYKAHLPERALHGSCVYHGGAGCVLPRDLRSRTCNRFRCFELREIDRQLETTRRRKLLAVARNGAAARALGVVDLDRAESAGLEAVSIQPIGASPTG